MMGMEVLPVKSLPVGFRFRPTDEELINHYLRSKINGNEEAVSVIREVDVCKCEPWDLPDKSLIKTVDDEWFFFCPKDRKYQNGQRLNRATFKGYWKATGKDRSIKSLRGTTVIGMKKTLVFYIGRAPSGQRTNWVIHEYRATSKDLDGTRPGQGSFVLCKLIKKHDEKLDGKPDENAEDSNLEEGIVFSPIDSAPPIFSSNESPPTKISDTTTPDVPFLVADYAREEVTFPPDFNLEKMLEMFRDPTLEQADGDGKIFSPLHTQMQVEFGSSYNWHNPSDVNHDHKGVLQFEYGTNEQDSKITEFLDSILVDSDELSSQSHDFGSNEVLVIDEGAPNYAIDKDTGSCSESIAQGFIEEQCGVALDCNQSYDLFNGPEESSCNSHAVGSGDETFGTGIRIRTRQSRYQPRAEFAGLQGTAPRRIRLQKELHVGSSYCSNFRNLSYKEEPEKPRQMVAKAEEAEEEHAAVGEALYFKSSSDAAVTQGLSVEAKSRGYLSPGCGKEVPTAGLRALASSWISPSMYMLRVLLILGLSFISVAMWRCIKF